MSMSDFHQRLRMLYNIDGDELKFLSDDRHAVFYDDPARFFIRCDDATADKLWAIIEKKLQPSLVGTGE